MRSSWIYHILLCLGVAAVTGSANAEPPYPDKPLDLSVLELSRDTNGDGRPDQIGAAVAVTGTVTAFSSKQTARQRFFVQDATAGVEVFASLSDFGIEAGDAVRIVGVVLELTQGQVALEARELKQLPEQAALPTAIWVEEDRVDLTELFGKRIETGGTVVRLDTDLLGPYVVVGRAGGPLVVRIPVSTDAESLKRLQIGEFVRVKGVLATASADSDWPVPRVIVVDTGDIVSSFPFETALSWLGFVVAAVIGLLVLVLSRTLLRRLKSRRERPFRAIFAQSGGAMIVADDQLRIIEANRSACRLLRQSYSQIKFRKLKQLFRVEDESIFSELSDTLSRGEPTTFLAGLWGEELSMVDLDVTISRIADRDRNYLLATIHDVTRHTDNANQYRLFHEELLDGMPVEVAVMSPSGKYLYANGYGYGDAKTREWVIGRSDIELCRKLGLPSEIALRRRAHRRRAITGKQHVDFEEVITTGGVARHILRSYQPVFEQVNGDVAAVASFGIDITELKESRRQLDQARLEIDKVGRLKETFLENINHEFRTPITGIIGFAEILETEVPEDQREFVNLIERNGRRLMNTLNAVLDLAGLNNNEFELFPQVLNIVEEIGNLVESSQEMAAEKGLFLKIEPSRPEILARADQVCMSRVIQNLIDNSIKFTEAGGIIIEVDRSDDFVHVRVLDTGVGIDAEFVPYVFDDFNQEAIGLDRSFEGVGVGLGITKRLIELMKGTITVESQKGEGSVFSINLPRAFPATGRFGPGKPRLLLVDDSADVNTMMHYVLEAHFQIELATDLDGLEILIKRKLYDAIMVDLDLGDYDVIKELVADVKKRYDGPPAPLIAIDDRYRRGVEEKVLVDGVFDRYVSKPFKKLSLVSLMSEVVTEFSAKRRGKGGRVSDEEAQYGKTG